MHYHVDSRLVPAHERKRRLERERHERLQCLVFCLFVAAIGLALVYTGVWG